MYLQLYSSERRKSYTPRMAWGWVNHGVILIFGWTNPLICLHDKQSCIMVMLLSRNKFLQKSSIPSLRVRVLIQLSGFILWSWSYVIYKPLFPIKAIAFLMPLLLTRFSSLTMNFSTLCCLILNILEPLFFMRDSSSNITSLGALILVPKSSSEASAFSSSWSGQDQCVGKGKGKISQS